MNITVKHIEELVSVHEKNFRVEEVNGKFTITVIRDYENKKTMYELHRILFQRLSPIKRLTEKLSNFIPNSLFVIKEKEINVPLNIETNFNIPIYGIVNNSIYGMGVDLAIDPYTTYVDINQMP
jgi:hypothetical protein